MSRLKLQKSLPLRLIDLGQRPALTIAALALALVPLGASAASNRVRSTQPAAPVEVAFLQQLHALNLSEIAAGTLAETHSDSAPIRQAGAQEVADHRTLEWQIAEMARQDGIALNPAAPGLALRQVRANLARFRVQLSESRGARFDTVFAHALRDSHDSAISLTEDAIKACQNKPGDEDLVALATGTLAHLQKHRRQADQWLDRAVAH